MPPCVRACRRTGGKKFIQVTFFGSTRRLELVFAFGDWLGVDIVSFIHFTRPTFQNSDPTFLMQEQGRGQ